MKYPINEIFYSLKGEGVWTGTPMLFIRLHGCNLKCSFCDTKDEQSEALHPKEILMRLQSLNRDCDRVVITGGEPLIHDLKPLLDVLYEEGYLIHLETNGTRKLPPNSPIDWIAISPKQIQCNVDTMRAADEIKFLVGQIEDFFWEDLLNALKDIYAENWAVRDIPLYVMPIAKSFTEGDRSIKDLNDENVQKAISWCKNYPNFSFCIQLHKVLNIS